MRKRMLGGLESSTIGLGCMSMAPVYGAPDPVEAIATIHRAIELGANHLDTSDAYDDGNNEVLVGQAIRGRRDQVVLATKFGNIRYPDGRRDVVGDPVHVRKACEASLGRLGTDVIDLFYVHRIDPKVPIEDTVGAMADLRTEGKIRFLGLSEAAPETLRRAHTTHPIAALQTEYSLWSRDAEAELLGLCDELGIGYVAYAPMGRGFLTGTIRSVDDLEAGDRRRDHPRFDPANIKANAALLDVLVRCAGDEGCTPAQLAIAWVMAQGEHIVPIPGTRRRKWLEENVAAAALSPSKATLAALDQAFAPGAAAGTRYPAGQIKRVNV